MYHCGQSGVELDFCIFSKFNKTICSLPINYGNYILEAQEVKSFVRTILLGSPGLSLDIHSTLSHIICQSSFHISSVDIRSVGDVLVCCHPLNVNKTDTATNPTCEENPGTLPTYHGTLSLTKGLGPLQWYSGSVFGSRPNIVRSWVLILFTLLEEKVKIGKYKEAESFSGFFCRRQSDCIGGEILSHDGQKFIKVRDDVTNDNDMPSIHFA